MEVAACGFAAYYDYSGAAPYELHCECLRCVLQRPQRRKALQLILIAILWPFCLRAILWNTTRSDAQLVWSLFACAA